MIGLLLATTFTIIYTRNSFAFKKNLDNLQQFIPIELDSLSYIFNGKSKNKKKYCMHLM